MDVISACWRALLVGSAHCVWAPQVRRLLFQWWWVRERDQCHYLYLWNWWFRLVSLSTYTCGSMFSIPIVIEKFCSLWRLFKYWWMWYTEDYQVTSSFIRKGNRHLGNTYKMVTWNEKSMYYKATVLRFQVLRKKIFLSGKRFINWKRRWLIKHATYMKYFSVVPPPVLLSSYASFPLSVHVIFLKPINNSSSFKQRKSWPWRCLDIWS